MLPSQVHIIKVSHHRLHDKKSRHQSKTKRLSNAIIHTNIGLSNIDRSTKIKSTDDHHHNLSLQSESHDAQRPMKYPMNAPHSVSVTKVRRRHFSLSQSNKDRWNNRNLMASSPYEDNSSIENNKSRKNMSKTKLRLFKTTKVSHHQDTLNNNHLHLEKKDTSSDQTGIINDHHRPLKKKKKCSRPCIILSILAILIVGIIISVVLMAILLPTKTKTSTIVVLRWNTTGITISGVSGIAGNTSSLLNSPLDVTLDYTNNAFYVADQKNNRVQKYLRGASDGTTVAGYANGTGCFALDCLRLPSRVLVDLNGNLYITDTLNQRIIFWAKGASSGTKVAGTGILGNASNQLSTPYGIAHDTTTDTLYIADYANHRIMSYLSGSASGNIAAGGNGYGLNQTQLYYPVGLRFDSLSNSLIIANHVANNILRWVLGDNSWTLLAGDINGLTGNTSAQLNRPTDVQFDPMGNMYVADRENHRIQLFMANQSEGRTIAGVADVSGNDSVLLNKPWSVQLDNQLNLYVADSFNHRIQKFVRY